MTQSKKSTSPVKITRREIEEELAALWGPHLAANNLPLYTDALRRQGWWTVSIFAEKKGWRDGQAYRYLTDACKAGTMEEMGVRIGSRKGKAYRPIENKNALRVIPRGR